MRDLGQVPDAITYRATSVPALRSKRQKGPWSFSRGCATKVKPDVFTYSALISAGAQGPKAEWALGLFQVMRRQHLMPDVITHFAYISACK